MLLLCLLVLAQEPDAAALIARLGADSIEAREDAFRKLEKIGRPALPLLEKAARDPDGEISRRAQLLLIRIPILERVTPTLSAEMKGIEERLARGEWLAVFLDLADDLRLPRERRRYPGVREADLSFLAPLAVQRAESDVAKSRVCEAVGRCRLASAYPDVARLLSDPVASVRTVAVAALRDGDAREQGAALRAMAADPSPIVRSVTAHALGRLKLAEARPELTQLLKDPSRDVRWWAVRALRDLGLKEAADAVATLKDDPDESVRRAAVETLEALRKP